MSKHISSISDFSERVRRAWAADHADPDLLRLLTPAVLADDEALAEGVVADAEERSARGLPATIEHYDRLIPGLQTRPEVCRALLMHEFGRHGPAEQAALADSLRVRLPALAEEIDLVAELCGLFEDSFGGPDLPGALLSPGDRLGKYDLVRRLGEGSFGEVWHAWDGELERSVALKLLHPAPASATGGSDGLSRVMSEARAAAGLDHDNIVAVHAAGLLAGVGRHYIDSQLVSDPDPAPDDPRRVRVGSSLDRAAIANGAPALTARESARIVEAVCRGVAAAHARGVLHRDIKPGNILLSPSGRVMVADFGLSTSGAPLRNSGSADTAATVSLDTARGRIVGTPAYMSPEQAEGERATPLSDVYALGATLRFLLTGSPPFAPSGRFSTDARWDVIEQVRRAEPPPLAKASPVVPRTLAAICDRAMAKRPEDRYLSAAQMADDLGAWLGGRPTAARPLGPPARAALFLRRHALAASIAGAAILALSAGGARYIIDVKRQRDRAVEAERLAERSLGEARTAEGVARAVNEFLQEMLQKPDPRQSGKDVTVMAALEAAAGKIEEKLKDQPAVEAGVRTVIGRTYRTLDDIERAAPQLERAVELRRQASGADDPEMLTTMHELALLHYEQRKPEQAADELKQVLEGRRRALPPDDPLTLTTINDLGTVSMGLGRLPEARVLFEESIAARTRVYGAEHVRTFTAQRSLAVVLFREGRRDEAEAIARQVVEGQRKVAGDRAVETLLAINDIAFLLRGMGKHAEAEPLSREAFEGYREVLPRGHTDVMLSGFNLISNLQALKKAAEGLEIANYLVESAETVESARSRLPTCRAYQGGCLVDLERWTEARAALEPALEGLIPSGGEKNRTAQSVIGLLVKVHTALGEPDKAAEYTARLNKPAAPAAAPPKP